MNLFDRLQFNLSMNYVIILHFIRDSICVVVVVGCVRFDKNAKLDIAT